MREHKSIRAEQLFFSRLCCFISLRRSNKHQWTRSHARTKPQESASDTSRMQGVQPMDSVREAGSLAPEKKEKPSTSTSCSTLAHPSCQQPTKSIFDGSWRRSGGGAVPSCQQRPLQRERSAPASRSAAEALLQLRRASRISAAQWLVPLKLTDRKGCPIGFDSLFT